MIESPRGRQIHDNVTFAAGKLQFGRLASALLAQSTLLLQDFRQPGWRKGCYQACLAFGETCQAMPLALECSIVKHSQRRCTDSDCDADHDDNEQSETFVVAHVTLPGVAAPWCCWRERSLRGYACDPKT